MCQSIMDGHDHKDPRDFNDRDGRDGDRGYGPHDRSDEKDLEEGSMAGITRPERSWTGGESSDPAPLHHTETHTSTLFTDTATWENPLFHRKSKRVDEKHAARLAEGIPSPWRFNPIKAIGITLRSTSRLTSYCNILFPTIPAGIALWYTSRKEYPLATFIFNFVAMVPAGNLLAFASGELHHQMPHTIGATLGIFTGAVVETIICIILLIDKQYDVVRAALLGSMFANLLLVSGICFIVGGIAFREQRVAEYITEVSSAALLVSAVGMVSPSLFYQTVHTRKDVGKDTSKEQTLLASRVVSIGLLVSYAAFLFFQLMTHSTAYHHVLERAASIYTGRKVYRAKLSQLEAIILTLMGLTFVSFAAYFMVQMIPYIVKTQGVSENFMGLIMVPLIEKFSEHLTALNQAWDNQIDLALSHCLGGTIQTALLVAPLVVLVGWAANLKMDLNFELFIALSLLLSIIVFSNFVRDGKTHWLKGMFLLMVYYVLSVLAFYDPNPPEGHGGGHAGGGQEWRPGIASDGLIG
ncbi:Vacuolar calcium ion transporter [Drechslerella dactyloides]|uniref:Vacuolar calcium ion transporter n=1 Tax=Drechslerella dactyloides TaxID=74499 RepID=A0AAD6J2C0_DREDA|nr:Vacuolar calcium ion transporter [Drechslerella dactyloides]